MFSLNVGSYVHVFYFKCFENTVHCLLACVVKSRNPVSPLPLLLCMKYASFEYVCCAKLFLEHMDIVMDMWWLLFLTVSTHSYLQCKPYALTSLHGAYSSDHVPNIIRLPFLATGYFYIPLTIYWFLFWDGVRFSPVSLFWGLVWAYSSRTHFLLINKKLNEHVNWWPVCY